MATGNETKRMNNGKEIEMDAMPGDGSGPENLPQSTASKDMEQDKTGSRLRRCCHEVSSTGQQFSQWCSEKDWKAICRPKCTLDDLRKKIPITKWLPRYTLSQFQGDLIAGLTVGLTVLPQSLAYANIAKLPPQYGLYSSFMGCFVYVFLGTSKDVTFGPTAVMSLLTAEFCSFFENDASYAIMLTLISGVIQIVMGILNIGFLVDYISHPVINSFTTAAAITIACSQVKKWLGLKEVPREFVKQFYWTIRKIPETKPFDFSLGLICMLLLYGMKRLKDVKMGKNAPQTKCLQISKYFIWLSSTARNAFVVVLASAVAAALFHAGFPDVFSLTRDIVQGIPPFKVPEFTLTYNNQTFTPVENVKKMGIGVVIVPLLGVIETIAIGKAFGRKHNYNIDANQELLAIGASNIVGSFFQSYPITASFSRSAVNAQSGVRTPAGGIYTGALVLLALAVLTPLFYYIPDAALAAVIIMAVTDMIDFSMIPKLWRVKKIDLLPWFTAFIVSLLLGFEYGIMLGVLVSLLLLLYPWSRPEIKETTNESGSILAEATLHPDIIVVTVSMGIMFPGIEHLQDQIEHYAFSGSNSKSVILNMRYVADLDFTSVQGMQHIQDYFLLKKAQLILCDVHPRVVDILTRGKVKHLRYSDSVDEAVRMISADLSDQAEEGTGARSSEQPRKPEESEGDPQTVAQLEQDPTVKSSASKLTRDGSVIIELTSDLPAVQPNIDDPLSTSDTDAQHSASNIK